MTKYENIFNNLYDQFIIDKDELAYFKKILERSTPKEAITQQAVIGGIIKKCECSAVQYHKGNFCYNCGQALKRGLNNG